MSPRDPTPGALPALRRLFLTVLAIVILAEGAVMFLLPLVLGPGADPFAAAFTDAALLTLIVAPLLWAVVVRPLRRAAAAKGARAAELLHLQRLALESAANAIVITDREGRITWVNPAFTHLTGYTPEEAIGQNMRLLKSGRHDQAFYRELWETILAGQVWQGEIINRRKDGSLYVDEQTITPVEDERGQISHFVTIQQDISERKRLEETLARRMRELEALNRIEAAVSGSLRLDEVLEQALDATLAALDMEAGEIFLLDEDRGEVVLRLHRGLFPEAFREISRFRLGEGFPGRVALAGEPLVTTDLASDLRFLRKEVAAAGFRSLACMPLTAGGKVIGTLDVATRAPRDFTAADRHLLTSIGAAIGMAVGNARLYKAVQHELAERKRAEEIRQALYQASLHIQGPLGLRDRLSRLLTTAREVLHLDRLNILLADPEGQWLEAVASIGTEGPSGMLRVPIGPEGGGIAQAYLTQQTIGWDGRGPMPESYRLKPPYDQIAAFRSHAFVNVPLVVQGRAIGVLGVDRKYSGRPFEPGMLELLQLFASHAAPAIEQARLYEELRRSAILLEQRVEDRTRDLQAANLKLEEALTQVEGASRHKSEFLSNMSHELRTPLNAVIGFSELLLGQSVGPLTEKQARYLGHIQGSGKHLLQLISDILDLAKVEAGKITLEPAPLPVATTLEDILVITRELANKKGQIVEADIAPDLPSLQADPIRFKQILFNLLSNAVKFTPEGGLITVAARRVDAEHRGTGETEKRGTGESAAPIPRFLDSPVPVEHDLLEIAVQDTGIGIKPEDLPKLFQPFSQLEAAYTKRHQGTGLGLALTRRLVELHGGLIWAASPGEGQGSTFTVLLPFEGTET